MTYRKTKTRRGRRKKEEGEEQEGDYHGGRPAERQTNERIASIKAPNKTNHTKHTNQQRIWQRHPPINKSTFSFLIKMMGIIH